MIRRQDEYKLENIQYHAFHQYLQVEPGEDSSDPMPAHESDPLDRLFDSHCGSDGVIDCFELQTILQALLKCNLSAAEFR